MRTIKLLRNATGMGLVEVMMAVAITGGLALTIAKLMENAGQNAKQIEAKTENINLKGYIQSILSDPIACKETFFVVMNATNVAALTTGAPTAAVTVPSIKDKLAAIKYSPASTNISPLTITSMEVTNYNAAAFTGDLIVNATFRKSSTMTMMVKPIRIPINFSFTGADLTACSTMAVGGGEWLLKGNAGTVDGTDYIGTSDNVALNFKVNAQKAGRISSTGDTFLGYQSGMSNTGSDNIAIGRSALSGPNTSHGGIAIGVYALASNTTGVSNIATGNRALYSNTTGNSNVATGKFALQYNTEGNYNVATGEATLSANTTGEQNTATGYSALAANTTGNYNVATGAGTLATNTTGEQNTASGFYALSSNTTGSFNIAFGSQPLRRNTTGNKNIAIGTNALQANLTGEESTAVGDRALFSSIGDFNTALGSAAGYNTNGRLNTFLGWSAGSNSFSGDRNLFLGANSGTGAGTASDRLYIETNGTANPLIGGNFSAASRYVSIDGKLGVGIIPTTYQLQLSTNSAAKPGSGTWTVASDSRLKDVRAPFVRGLDALAGIRPVYFRYKAGNELGLPTNEEFVGIIAQEAKKAVPESVKTDDKGYLQVTTDSIIWTMFNGIKELYAQVVKLITSDEKQNLEIKTLKAENKKLMLQMQQLQDSFEVRMKKLEAKASK